MNNFDLLKFEVNETDGVFTFKNDNTTLGIVRFNKIGEVEYIFVNPIFRNQGLAKQLLKLVKEKFSYTSSTKRIMEVYFELLNEK